MDGETDFGGEAGLFILRTCLQRLADVEAIAETESRTIGGYQDVMNSRYLWTCIITVAVVWQGCKTDLTAQRIHELRTVSELDSAYALALDALTTNVRRDDVWMEFVRTCVEISRHPELSRVESTMPYLVQAGLACGAMFERSHGKPGTKWQEVGRLVSGEYERQLNTILKTFYDQMRITQHCNQLRESRGLDRRGMTTLERLQEEVAECRMNARPLLERLFAIQGIYERLPESGARARKALTEQLTTALGMWQEALGFDPGFEEPVREDVAMKVTRAFQRAADDWKELGYLIPSTLIENEIYE